VGDPLDDAAFGHELTGALRAKTGATRSLDLRGSHGRVMALDGLEVGEKRPDLLEWAAGLHFMLDDGHGTLHK
jgi:hypothetical protein